MQLLTDREINNLKTTGRAMIDATEILLDWGTISAGSLLNLGITVHRSLTSKRAIAGYKAVWACCQLVYLLGVACFLSLKKWVDPLSRPAILGELVIPTTKEPKSIPDPWESPSEFSVVTATDPVCEQPAIALLPPATPAKKARKPRVKKVDTEIAEPTRKRTRKAKNSPSDAPALA